VTSVTSLDRAMRIDVLARAERKSLTDPGMAHHTDLTEALDRLSNASSEALAAVAFHLGLEQSEHGADADGK
jgi:hypothetical protein